MRRMPAPVICGSVLLLASCAWGGQHADEGKGVGNWSLSDVQERAWVCTSMYWFVVLRRAHVVWRH
ncbi:MULTISPECIES: hypothetical protein [unclassified Streptomyces]|uniref:hypothetical protein n=1 Tax=unclassified Streptomyces TaxID=2593676 RepID=UPI003D8DD3B0